ncbi:hypothetical protein HA150_06305 [Prochlorococcus marinus XMU1414]|uniref:Uncharacterized protein n=1 Tax=Prochlorococcus marinus XMU1424 TaxID=2774497 RepID=A0A9D9BW89_PROMR|nr:hypothetical protein [Prochlorococcus marinus]MBO8228511.1 hypothetical protein [Prochlorococcus marinus XMU1414]MBW3045998.1 hypothetical protein [Prochlorococcus marinus str. MU1414]MCR8531717.1 hypothetical protein [Prochlorococcus marinus XMU1420]MCR8535446.1 hypothetical protein [Prochlorococcus marinus XMU1424]
MNKLLILLPFIFIVEFFSNSKAEYLYRNEAYDNSIYGNDAYRSSGGKTFYEIDDDDYRRSGAYDSQIIDKEGNLYNCSYGSCKKDWRY